MNIHEDIMDQQKQIKSIAEVQEAEAYAIKTMADAGKEKDKLLADAREKAANIVSVSINDSKEKRELEVKKFTAELEDRKKRAIEKALKDSKSTKDKRLSQTKRKEVVNRLVRIILGV